MKRKLYTFAALLAASAMMLSCAKEAGNKEVAVDETASVDETCMEQGMIIVEFSEEMTKLLEGDLCKGNFTATKSGIFNGVMDGLNVVKVERLYPDAGEWEPRHREAGLHRWYMVTYDESIPATKASADLGAVGGISYVEPVRKKKQMGDIFDDPRYFQQWGFLNRGADSDLIAGCDIDVVPVWENFTGGSSDVIVSIIDGGIEQDHPDLKAVCVPGGTNGSKNFVDNSFKIIAHDHGTHVAGTIGAINNNGIGVCGAAGGLDGNGGVRLMSCQVFKHGSDGKDVSAKDFGEAMIWGADHGAVISQNSWGFVFSTESDAAKGGVGAMKNAIDYFIKYAGTDKNGNQVGPMKGGLVIFAAGNDGYPHGWPAEYSATEPLCVSVGAVSSAYTTASYSNYGDWVTICAPGGDMERGVTILSTIPGKNYGWMQGTSMACPHVSGVAALIVSYFGGPGFTNQMLRDRLVGGARPNVVKGKKIGPMVDAYRSFTYGDTTAPDPVESYSVQAQSNNIDFTWNVTKDGGAGSIGKAQGYLLLACKDKSKLEGANPKSLPSDVAKVIIETGDKKVGEAISGTIGHLDFKSTYYTAIFAYDNANNYSTASSIKSAVTKANNPPVVSTNYQGDYKVHAHETLRVEYEMSDPDGHSFTVKFSGGSDAATDKEKNTSSHTLTIVGNKAPAGKYTACYTVTDEYGLGTEYKIEYELLPNHAPSVKKQVDNMIFEDTAQRAKLNMDEYIEDEDGEILKYTASSSSPVISINSVENVLNITSLDWGIAQVTLTGTDAGGLQVKLPFQVLVRDPKTDPDVYPNPVVDVLKISDGSKKLLKVTLHTSLGAVISETSGEYDAFNPLTIDMSGYAPGRYGVTVETPEKTVKKSIMKL